MNLRILERSFFTSACVNSKKWKLKHPKPAIVDVKLLKPTEPVSGSIEFSEDLTKVNTRKFEFDLESMSKRGFLRFQKGYDPPPNTIEQFLLLAKSVNPKLEKLSDKELVDFELSDSRVKYDLLSRAHKEFKHAFPNSLLHFILTVRDALKFYNTRVNINTPYDDIQNLPNLPQNLHIQKNAVRFDPDTDTMFDGVSAFPKSSTIVTGLRARKIYKSLHAKRVYLDFK